MATQMADTNYHKPSIDEHAQGRRLAKFAGKLVISFAFFAVIVAGLLSHLFGAEFTNKVSFFWAVVGAGVGGALSYCLRSSTDS